MNRLHEVTKKYEKSKKDLNFEKQRLRDLINQQIQTLTIKSLKIQNYKVSQIHKNQRLIQEKLKRNSEMQQQMRKHMTHWTNLYDDLNKALKNAGDLAHYAQYIQGQLDSINGKPKSDLQNQDQQLN